MGTDSRELAASGTWYGKTNRTTGSAVLYWERFGLLTQEELFVAPLLPCCRTQYRKGSRIVDIARQPGVRYSPYLMARILVGELEPGAVYPPRRQYLMLDLRGERARLSLSLDDRTLTFSMDAQVPHRAKTNIYMMEDISPLRYTYLPTCGRLRFSPLWIAVDRLIDRSLLWVLYLHSHVLLRRQKSNLSPCSGASDAPSSCHHKLAASAPHRTLWLCCV